MGGGRGQAAGVANRLEALQNALACAGVWHAQRTGRACVWGAALLLLLLVLVLLALLAQVLWACCTHTPTHL